MKIKNSYQEKKKHYLKLWIANIQGNPNALISDVLASFHASLSQQWLSHRKYVPESHQKPTVQNLLARSHLLIKLLTCFNIYSYLPCKGTESGSTEIKPLSRGSIYRG